MNALAGARIGPNALIQVAHALAAAPGEASARHLFRLAGLAGYLDAPPASMVDELEVARLHRSVRANLGPAQARRVFRDAGQRTAMYLLANRIPRPLQALLRRMPSGLAARVLLRAIGQHAWTFAGSGRFEARYGQPVVLTITGNPLCRGVASLVPVCDYYAATFEHLFRSLVHPETRVIETACEATGAPACVLELSWRARPT